MHSYHRVLLWTVLFVLVCSADRGGANANLRSIRLAPGGNVLELESPNRSSDSKDNKSIKDVRNGSPGVRRSPANLTPELDRQPVAIHHSFDAPISVNLTTPEGLELRLNGVSGGHFELVAPHITTQERPSWCPIATAAAILNSFGPYNVFMPQWINELALFDQSEVFVMAGALAPGPLTCMWQSQSGFHSSEICFRDKREKLSEKAVSYWGKEAKVVVVDTSQDGAYDDYEFYSVSRKVDSTRQHSGDWLEESMDTYVEPSLHEGISVLRPNCRGYPNGPDFKLRKWFVDIFSPEANGAGLRKTFDPVIKDYRSKMWPWSNEKDPDQPPPPGILGFLWGEMIERISAKLVPLPFRHAESGMKKWSSIFDATDWEDAMKSNSKLHGDHERTLDFHPGIKVEFVPMFNPEKCRSCPHETITDDNCDQGTGRGLSEQVWQASHNSERGGVYNVFEMASGDLSVAMKMVKDEIRTESKARNKYIEWLRRMVFYLDSPCKRIAASYFRLSVGQPGIGHFAPIIAYNEKQVPTWEGSDKVVPHPCIKGASEGPCIIYFLIADVTLFKAPFIWAEASSFYSGLIFPDSDDPLMPSRGTLFIDGPVGCQQRPAYKHGTVWVKGGLGYDGRCNSKKQICQIHDDARAVELSLPQMHEKFGACTTEERCP